MTDEPDHPDMPETTDLEVSVSEPTIRVYGYITNRHLRPDRDRSLPEKGVSKSSHGVRRGRDGRLVRREAVYDPDTDLASEKVVDVETGEVIVNKVESMKDKYRRRGRWKPPQDDSDPE